MKAVIDSMGGPEKVTVLFPKHGGSMALSSDEITLRGHSSLLPELKKAFDKVVCDFLKSGSETKWSNFTDLYASGVSDCAVLPSVDIGRVIGRGGDGLTEIMKKFNVALFVSDNVGTEPSSVNVSIRGYSDEQVKLAKQHLAVCGFCWSFLLNLSFI